MNTKVVTLRALGAFVARRALNIITFIFAAVITLLLALVAYLAIRYNAWWWMFAFPLLAISLVYGLFYFIFLHAIHIVYRHPFSIKQHEALTEFTNTIQRVAETSSLSFMQFALTTLGEITTSREPKTLSNLISDTAGLKSDFQTLESYFGDR